MDHPHPAVLRGIGIADCRAVIGTSIIHQKQFKIGKGLCKDTVYTFMEIVSGIVNRDNYTDLRNTTISFL